MEGSTTISGFNDFGSGTLDNFGAVTQNSATFDPVRQRDRQQREPAATWALQSGSSITNSGAFNNLGTLPILLDDIAKLHLRHHVHQ